MITAYIGVIGSGKDYRANKLEAAGAVRVDFKDALLDLVSDIVGYDVREDYEWFKENVIGLKRNTFSKGDAPAFFHLQNFGLMTGRQMLQGVGAAMRKRDPNYWCRAWQKKAYPYLNVGKDVVIADCRYENEISAVTMACVKRKFVFCDFGLSPRYQPNDPHESEKLAQAIKSRGFKDGHELTLEEIAEACRLIARPPARPTHAQAMHDRIGRDVAKAQARRKR